MASEGVLIDTGGLDKFLDPDTPYLKRFWDQFREARHFITPLVYWEFLNAFDQYNPMRKRFKKMIDAGSLQFLPFGQVEAERASEIYLALTPIVAAIPQRKKRERLEALQCDVFIAATAHRHRKRVFTMDPDDWRYIRLAIEDFSSLPLEIVYGKDLEPAGKKR